MTTNQSRDNLLDALPPTLPGETGSERRANQNMNYADKNDSTLKEHSPSASANGSTASSCPQWLIDRMEALKKLPPPTLEEVETQFRACENWSFEHRFDGLKNPMR